VSVLFFRSSRRDRKIVDRGLKTVS
jgi:hypothetical protein